MPPHATEDYPLLGSPQLLHQFDQAATHAVLVETLDRSVAAIFGRNLTDYRYVLEGAQTRSLGGISAARRNLEFSSSFGRLRLIFRDQEGIFYELPMTAEDVLVAFKSADADPPLLAEANKWIASGAGRDVILRIGLARVGWTGEELEPEALLRPSERHRLSARRVGNLSSMKAGRIMPR